MDRLSEMEKQADDLYKRMAQHHHSESDARTSRLITPPEAATSGASRDWNFETHTPRLFSDPSWRQPTPIAQRESQASALPQRPFVVDSRVRKGPAKWQAMLPAQTRALLKKRQAEKAQKFGHINSSYAQPSCAPTTASVPPPARPPTVPEEARVTRRSRDPDPDPDLFDDNEVLEHIVYRGPPIAPSHSARSRALSPHELAARLEALSDFRVSETRSISGRQVLAARDSEAVHNNSPANAAAAADTPTVDLHTSNNPDSAWFSARQRSVTSGPDLQPRARHGQLARSDDRERGAQRRLRSLSVDAADQFRRFATAVGEASSHRDFTFRNDGLEPAQFVEEVAGAVLDVLLDELGLDVLEATIEVADALSEAI